MAASYTPWSSSPSTRRVMQANRSRDTQPELALRRAVYALGLRYRVDARPLPALNRRADMVFTKAKVAVFIDGCYWHGCPAHGTQPKTNADYWSSKIGGNIARDRETDLLLLDAGWLPIRVWEHDEPGDAAERVAEAARTRAIGRESRRVLELYRDQLK